MTGRRDDGGDARRSLGALGEARAAEHLERRGYRIVARNVRVGGVELDLIARRGPWLVFVEVKARRTLRFGAPEEAVDARKQRRLVRGASAWLAEHPHRGQVRFDVIVLEPDPKAPREPDPPLQLRHIEAAFETG